MQPQIVKLPAFTVAGKLYHGNNEKNEIALMWREYGPQMQHVNHVVEPHVSYGVMDNFDSTTGEFDYIAAQKVSQVEDLPPGVVSWQIPQQTYAVFSTTLPTLREVFDKIYNEWLPESGYGRALGPEFELYDERFNPAEIHSKLDLYIPIRKV